MPKVVINNCYGGFGLSPKAVARLAELQGKRAYFFNHSFSYEATRYAPIKIEECKSLFWDAFTVPNPEEVLGGEKKWHDLNHEERKARNEAYNSIHIDPRPDKRDDPLLIQVIEELGEEANASHAKLKIVEIPDGVEWHIEEYDGHEYVV